MLENVMVAQITKFKNKVHLFLNFVSGRTLLTYENVYEVSLLENVKVGQIKKFKKKVHLFLNFVSGRTLLNHENVYEGLNARKCI